MRMTAEDLLRHSSICVLVSSLSRALVFMSLLTIYTGININNI
jgi:hypothetical protein